MEFTEAIGDAITDKADADVELLLLRSEFAHKKRLFEPSELVDALDRCEQRILAVRKALLDAS